MKRLYSLRPNSRVVRVIGASIGISVSVYLAISLWNDLLLHILPGMGEPGIIEDHLAGNLGAWVNTMVRDLIGAAFPVALLFPALLAIGMIRDWGVTRLLARQAIALVVLIALPAALGAIGMLVDTSPGGAIGSFVASALADPIGPAGAILFPVTVMAVIAALFIRRDQAQRLVASTILVVSRIFGGKNPDPDPFLERPQRPTSQTSEIPTNPHPTAERKAQPDLEGRMDRNSLAYRALARSEDVTGPSHSRRAIRTEPDTAESTADETDLPELPFSTSAPSSTSTVQAPEQSNWRAPEDLFLDTPELSLTEAEREAELSRQGRQLMDTLATYKVKGRLMGRTVGPRVVCYHVELDGAQKVSAFENLERELGLKLRQQSVRVTTVPASGAIGIEVPHPAPRDVSFKEVYESDAFACAGTLPIVLGLDVEGRPVARDLSSMPHMLVAGATGSGKSVALNSLLASLIATRPPEDLRLLLIDPKKVELDPYSDLPHLRHDVITEPDEAAHVLKWATQEMDRRYNLLQEAGVRHIDQYREWAVSRPDATPLPYLLIVVDELGDLMLGEHRGPIESALVQLAQKARAIGIHLVLATQRPTAEVVTGLLTANIPCRAGFRVPRGIDSRVILDQTGAERLMGKGDMLFIGGGDGRIQRLQGTYLQLGEVRNLVNWAQTLRPDFIREDDIGKPSISGLGVDGFPEISDADAKLLPDALRVCVDNDKASTSLLQRRLRIGYSKAARILDQMEHMGWVTESSGTSSRDVLVGLEAVEDL